MTEHIKVKIRTVDTVRRFVDLNGLSECDTRIYITPDMYVSGDSIMGIFSISLLKPLTVLIKSDREDDIRKLLKSYELNDISYTTLEGDRKK